MYSSQYNISSSFAKPYATNLFQLVHHPQSFKNVSNTYEIFSKERQKDKIYKAEKYMSKIGFWKAPVYQKIKCPEISISFGLFT